MQNIEVVDYRTDESDKVVYLFRITTRDGSYLSEKRYNDLKKWKDEGKLKVEFPGKLGSDPNKRKAAFTAMYAQLVEARDAYLFSESSLRFFSPIPEAAALEQLVVPGGALPTIVFIHGAFMTSTCWDKFTGYFRGLGFNVVAPSWPGLDRAVHELKSNPPEKVKELGIPEILAHYREHIGRIEGKVVGIGHSFGGLFAQMLLDEGTLAAAVAIDSAPPKGVIPLFYGTVLKSLLSVTTKANLGKSYIRPTVEQFAYSFCHTTPHDEQQRIYEEYVVPAIGKVFKQAGAAELTAHTQVNFANNVRGPLLLVAGTHDHVCPEKQILDNYQRYQAAAAAAVTDLKVFASRTHWIIAEKNWQEVATYCANWVITRTCN